MSENIYNGSFSIGIIGLGTIGSLLSRTFSEKGIQCCAYDILYEKPEARESIQAHATALGAKLTSLQEMIQQNAWIISCVTTQEAEEVARQCLPYLKKGQVFFDVNSTSSDTKKYIQQIVFLNGASFVEGVILNAVKPTDTTIHLLTAGDRGEEVAEFLMQMGIHAKFYNSEVGKASQFKMIRSIFSKGMEALLLETMVAAKKAGIDREIWEEITSHIDSKPFSDIANIWIQTHPRSCERRFYEIQQVIQTMNDIDVEPILTQATLKYFGRSVELELHKSSTVLPYSSEDVIDLFLK